MKNPIRFGLMATVVATGLMAGLSSCNSSKEDVQVSAPLFKVGQAVSTKVPLQGSIKGTLLSDSVYRVTGDVFINETDTLVIQPGAKIYFPGGTGQVYNFIVKGSLLSLGTQAKPIYFTVPTAVKPIRTALTQPPIRLTKASGVVFWAMLRAKISSSSGRISSLVAVNSAPHPYRS